MKKPKSYFKFYVLVVIDMQKGFEAACYEYVVNGVLREIEKAKQLKHPIVVVSYSNSGRILPKINKALKGYNDVIRVKKDTDDGSYQISNALANIRGLGLGYNYWFKICGVNINACVKDTVNGMRELYEKAKFEIVADACGTNCFWYGAESTKQSKAISFHFRNARNVKVKNLNNLKRVEKNSYWAKN